jgi:hypothetical protein
MAGLELAEVANPVFLARDENIQTMPLSQENCITEHEMQIIYSDVIMGRCIASSVLDIFPTHCS